MPDLTYSDQSLLLQEIADGDELAFRKLYNIYSDRIYFLSFKLVGDDARAKHILQELLVKLWLNREKLPGIEQLSAYINSMVRNQIYSGWMLRL